MMGCCVKIIVITSILFPNVSCGRGSPRIEAQSGSLKGFYDRTVLWQEAKIRVCWERLEERFERERLWVQQKIHASWEKHASVSFQYWGVCKNSEHQSVRIGVMDSSPHTKGIGRSLAGKINGVTLNFQFKRWKKECAEDAKVKQFCIQTIALHEFGHVLGLLHEHLRDDREPECRKQISEVPLSSHFDSRLARSGAYDSKSIMNYCYWQNFSNRLSRGDIRTISQLYKRHNKVDFADAS